MLKCPSCGGTTSKFHYTGYVNLVKGAVSIDSDGKISAVGPQQIVASVKTGAELSGKHIRVECPHCGKSFPYTEFTIMRVCFISGGEATETITFFGKTVYVAKHMVAVAEAMERNSRNRNAELELLENVLYDSLRKDR